MTIAQLFTLLLLLSSLAMILASQNSRNSADLLEASFLMNNLTSSAPVATVSNMWKQNEAALLGKLLEKYDQRSRPVKNISTTIFLDLSMYLVQILKLSEKDQVLTSNVWLILTWHDEMLQWNASEWGMDKIRIPARLLWLPDLTLYNNAQEADPILSNMMASTAVAQSDGSVTLWPRPLILQSNCRIDVLYFPFDTQNCHLKFSSWAYSATQVNLTSNEGAVYLDDYIPSTEWQLDAAYTEVTYTTYVEGDGGYSFIKFQIAIRRKALYYIVNLIMPCMMLTLVMLFGQYLPCNSGDAKVQLGTALFTSMCVFLLLVGTMMPPSDVQPLLGLYYGITLLLITMSTALNVIVLNVIDRDTEVPYWVRLVFLNYLARIVAPRYHKEWQQSTCKTSRAIYTPPTASFSVSDSFPAAPPDLNVGNCDFCTPELFVHAHLNGVKNGVMTSSTPCAKAAAVDTHSVHYSSCIYDFTTGSAVKRRGDNCSFRLASSRRQNVTESPIREIMTNVNANKLDENGRLLLEMKTHLGEIRRSLGAIERSVKDKSEIERVHGDWLNVAVVLDRTLMILFTLFTLSISMFVYSMYPSQLIKNIRNTEN